MCSLSKEQFALSRETIQNAFFFRIMPHFQLRKTLTFCNISVITEDIYLKLGVCVHYPKRNPYYQEKYIFSELCPFFDLDVLSSSFILYQAFQS